jgi:hypothetical protein
MASQALVSSPTPDTLNFLPYFLVSFALQSIDDSNGLYFDQATADQNFFVSTTGCPADRRRRREFLE